jgi:hypothetical protein
VGLVRIWGIGKKAEVNWALVGMIVLLVLIIVFITLPAGIFESTEEGMASQECMASFYGVKSDSLWISSKKTVIDNEKNPVDLKCKTFTESIESDNSRKVSGRIVTLMENCRSDYKKQAEKFYLTKGNICISCYRVDTPLLTSIGDLPELLDGKNLGGFGLEHYINFDVTNEVAVMMVFGFGNSFINGFSFIENSGVMLWDTKKFAELPCAILEGDPYFDVVKGNSP